MIFCLCTILVHSSHARCRDLHEILLKLNNCERDHPLRIAESRENYGSDTRNCCFASTPSA